MTELTLLNFFLAITFILAPLMTNHFFLNNSKIYSYSHIATLLILLIGIIFHLDYLAGAWPLFCTFGFFLYLKNNSRSIFSIKGFATSIPFLFSLISSTWFFTGINDLHLLGYSRAWSFYAALHGGYLGWIFVGCLVFLSKRNNSSKLYLWGCYLNFILFLLIAFGIDGIPHLKRIGVIGFSLVVPLLIGHYTFNLKKENRLSRYLSFLSLFSIIISMIFAILNEFWLTAPRVAFGIPIMVFTHGFINAVLAIPCFYLSIRFENNENSKAITT